MLLLLLHIYIPILLLLLRSIIIVLYIEVCLNKLHRHLINLLVGASLDILQRIEASCSLKVVRDRILSFYPTHHSI